MTTSNARQPSDSRDQVLVAHAAEMIARTAFSTARFAEQLADQLHALVPSKATDAGVPNFESLAAAGAAGPFLKASAAWLKRVQRWLDGEVDLPSWVEEAWVQALEPAYRERCINELAARHGLIGARAIGTDGCAVTAFGHLVSRLGGTVEACGVVLADGRIDAADVPHLPAMVEALLVLESRAHELRRVAENQLALHVASVPLRVVG